MIWNQTLWLAPFSAIRQNNILDVNTSTCRKAWMWKCVIYPKYPYRTFPQEISVLLLIAAAQHHRVSAASRQGNWGKLSKSKITQKIETLVTQNVPQYRRYREYSLLHFFSQPTGFTEFILTIHSCQSSLSPLKELMKTSLHKKHFSWHFTFLTWNIFQPEAAKIRKNKSVVDFCFWERREKNATDLLWIPPCISYFSNEAHILLFRFQK